MSDVVSNNYRDSHIFVTDDMTKIGPSFEKGQYC
jgi:hypothetical protein